MKAAEIILGVGVIVAGVLAGMSLRNAGEQAKASRDAAASEPRVHILRIGADVPAYSPAEIAERMALLAEEIETATTCETLLTRAECNAIFVRSFFDCFEGPDELVSCDCQCSHDHEPPGGDGDVDLRDFAHEQASSQAWIEAHTLDWEGR